MGQTASRTAGGSPRKMFRSDSSGPGMLSAEQSDADLVPRRRRRRSSLFQSFIDRSSRPSFKRFRNQIGSENASTLIEETSEAEPFQDPFAGTAVNRTVSPETVSVSEHSIELQSSSDDDVSFQSTSSTVPPLPNRPPPPIPNTREDTIRQQFSQVQNSLDSSLLTQFDTLTGLLDVVTITTLRRLVNSDTNFVRQNDEFDPERDCYRGDRIDRVLEPLEEPDVDTTDRTFSEFITGLRSEHLLARELGGTFAEAQATGEPQRNMSFFRAFRFDNTELIGFASTSRRFERLIPVLIVGVVGVPNVSTSEEESQRTWIVIVMAQYYPWNDPALQSMPEFVNILLEYAVSSDNDNFASAGAADNDVMRALRVRPGLPPLNRQISELPPETEAFRESLRALLERVRCGKRLSKDDLDRAQDSVYKVRLSDVVEVEKHLAIDKFAKTRTMAMDERCPICLIDYEEDELCRVLPKCQHEFHKDCIDEWLLQGDNTCPICRGRGIELDMIL